MTVKWIIADVDGCLTPEESEAWDLNAFADMAARIRAANRGECDIAPITLCTGRPQPYVEALLKLFDIRVPAICENGAVLYSLHDNRSHFGPNVNDENLAGLRRTREFIEKTVVPEDPHLVFQFGKEAQLSLYADDPSHFGPARERIEDFVEREGLPPVVINASQTYLNISMKDVDKGNALRLLAEQLEADHDELAGIGDTVGDLALRETVGFFACPSNSQDEIKEVADYISPEPVMRGVLDILSRPEMKRR